MNDFLLSLVLNGLAHILDADRAKVAAWAAKHGQSGALVLDVYDFADAYSNAKLVGSATVQLSGASVSISKSEAAAGTQQPGYTGNRAVGSGG